MSSWAPIVHGRTAFVDYRSDLIVVPDGFTQADIEWARSYILATTESAEKLRGVLRWCVFRDTKRTVVGVTCEARQLSDRYYRDRNHRSLYVFLGYVANDPEAFLPPRELSHFSGLYEYVIDRWEEQSWEARGIRPEAYRFTLPHLEAAGSPEEELRIRLSSDKIGFFPADFDDELWRAADVLHGTVALGLPSLRQAEKGPFHHATVMGIDSPHYAPRPEEGSAEKRPAEKSSSAPKRPATDPRHFRKDPSAGPRPIRRPLCRLPELNLIKVLRKGMRVGFSAGDRLKEWLLPTQGYEPPPFRRDRETSIPPIPDSDGRTAESVAPPRRPSGIPEGFKKRSGGESADSESNKAWSSWDDGEDEETTR